MIYILPPPELTVGGKIEAVKSLPQLDGIFVCNFPSLAILSATFTKVSSGIKLLTSIPLLLHASSFSLNIDSHGTLLLIRRLIKLDIYRADLTLLIIAAEKLLAKSPSCNIGVGKAYGLYACTE